MTSPRLLLASLSLLLAAGCAAPAGDTPADDEVGEAQEAVRMLEQNTHNSLGPESLFLSPIAANPQALDRLVGSGMQEALGSTYMRLQLHAPTAVRAMKYVAGCALNAQQSVTTSDAITGAPITFQGELGLCPDWLSGAPSPECRERVSACVLARVNMAGVRVPISLHGTGVSGDGTYLPEPVLKSKSAVAGNNACATPTYGTERNCGWWPVGAGTCSPGESVTIGAGANVANCASPLGGASGDTMLRVCKDIYSCDTTTPASDAPYSGRLKTSDDECGGRNPSVTFPCPDSGFYSVMAASYDSRAPAPVDFRVAASNGGFPASEPQVFPYVEGAFYGDIFDSSKLAPFYKTWVDAAGVLRTNYAEPTSMVGVVLPPLYAGGFACYSARISDGGANLAQRLCTLGSCLIPITGACREQASGLSGPTYRCARTNAAGAGEYDECTGTDGRVYTHPITTYLHNPCDTVTLLGGTPPASCQLPAQFFGIKGP